MREKKLGWQSFLDRGSPYLLLLESIRLQGVCHGPTERPPSTRSDPGAACIHAHLPRLRCAALGGLQDATIGHPPARLGPAPASGPTLPRTAMPPLRRPPAPRAGGALRPPGA